MIEEFNPDRVRKLVESDRILKGAYERTNRRTNRGEPSLRAIFNALIKNDKKFMELYLKTT